MNKQLLGILLLVFGLTSVFLIMSCAPATQNTNQASNANVVAAREVKFTKPCTLSSVNTDTNSMINAAGLKDQHDGTGNQYGLKNIDYKVFEMGNPVVKVMFIQGAISDGKRNDNSKNSEHMEKLIREIDQLITKDCVDKAVFVKRGTFDSLSKGELKAEDIRGFEWSTCEWPNMPCAGGTCAQMCPEAVANVSSNANSNWTTNSNSNSNSNSKSNANSNTNRAP